MGHDTLVCPKCGNLVMEGRNDWKCCGMICNFSTGFSWKEVEKPIKKKVEKSKEVDFILSPIILI